MKRLFFILLIGLMGTVSAQYGRNKVQYETFEWRYIVTSDFRIFYPKGYEHLVDFARIELESALEQLTEDFSYTPSNSSAASDVYKRQVLLFPLMAVGIIFAVCLPMN